MVNAETIYQKVRQLDTFRLQEVADFIDFILSKTSHAKSVSELPVDLAAKAGVFWQPQPLSYYLKNQQTIPDMDETDFWPEDESIDDFVAFIRQQRREDTEQSV